MSKLQRRIGRERQTLVDARDVLGRRKNERTEELDRYLALEHERQTSLRETRRSAREALDRKSTRLNSSHLVISYAVFCLKKKKTRLNSTHIVISYAVFCLKKKTSKLYSDLCDVWLGDIIYIQTSNLSFRCCVSVEMYCQ